MPALITSSSPLLSDTTWEEIFHLILHRLGDSLALGTASLPPCYFQEKKKKRPGKSWQREWSALTPPSSPIGTRQEGEEAAEITVVFSDERKCDESSCRESSLISPCNAVNDSGTSLKNKQINNLPLSSLIISLLLLLIGKQLSHLCS